MAAVLGPTTVTLEAILLDVEPLPIAQIPAVHTGWRLLG
jgi:hypothetical protein